MEKDAQKRPGKLFSQSLGFSRKIEIRRIIVQNIN